MPHDDPVLVVQRHHVGDDAQGRQGHGIEQKLAVARRDLGTAALPLRQSPCQLERDGRTGQEPEWIVGTGQTRMHQNRGVGQRLLELMMVRDDQFQTKTLRFCRLFDAGDAAVHSDYERGFRRGDLPQGIAVQSVALFEAVRKVQIGLGTEKTQTLEKYRAAGDTIDVVVAIDTDLSAALCSCEDAVGGFRNAGQEIRRMEPRQRCVQKTARPLGGIDAAVEQQLGDHMRGAQIRG